MATGLEIRQLEAGDMLDLVYKEILEPAFTPAELETLDYTREAFASSGPNVPLGLYAIEGEVPVGCAIYYPFAERRTLLLGYMAIRPSYRSRGVGHLLFEDSKRRWFADDQYDFVIAEIDDPRYFPPEGDIDPERRIAFYSRLGAELIVTPYIQPRIRAGADRVYDMLLIVLHAAPSVIVNPGRSVESGRLADFMTEYFDAEGDAGSDDPDRSWLMGWYESHPTLELLPLADYRSRKLPRAPSRVSD